MITTRRIALAVFSVVALGGGGAAGAPVEEAWAVRHDLMVSLEDSAVAAGFDAEGNVYVVAGSCYEEECGTLIIKYDAQGTEVWSRSYPETNPTAAAVDGAGNVYVTGSAVGKTGWFTVKCDSNGVHVWSAVRNSGIPVCVPIAAALAPEGDLLVAGQYMNGSMTVKYRGGDGTEVWAKDYEGQFSIHDRIRALGVDAAGNVVVTGTASNGLNRDIATIKYDAAGNELWTASFDGVLGKDDYAEGLGVDGAGNLYVVGHTIAETGYSVCVTIKYAPDGTLAWVRCYSGMKNWPELVVDDAGNVHIIAWGDTGYDILTYDSEGNELWARLLDRRGTYLSDWYNTTRPVATDGEGNLYITVCTVGETTDYDFLTAKYDPAGNVIWSTIYDGIPSGQEKARAIAVDGAGNVIAAGGSGADVAAVRYDAAGIEQWSARHDQTGSGEDTAYAIAADSDGNVYVSGITGSSSRQPLLVKYDAAGNKLWEAVHDVVLVTEPPSYGYHHCVRVDAGDSVYVTGINGEDSFIVKYAPDGTKLWAHPVGGRSLAFDDNGNCYVGMDINGGMAMIDRDGNLDLRGMFGILPLLHVGEQGCLYGAGTIGGVRVTVVKYDNAGGMVWGASSSSYIEGLPVGLGVDSAGSVYVAANKSLLRFDGADNETWAVTCPVSLARMVYHPAGYLYVTGSSTSGITTAKYDTDGKQLWAVQTSGDAARDMTVDAAGNVYVAGNIGGDMLVLKYDAHGSEVWRMRHAGGAMAAICLDSDEDVCIVGSSEGQETRSDFLTVKLVQEKLGGRFLRGDPNASADVDIADAVFLLSHLFAQGAEPSCLDAGDTNDSGQIDIADAIAVLSHLFAQAGPLPAPFGECGADPTDDGLECGAYAPCE